MRTKLENAVVDALAILTTVGKDYVQEGTISQLRRLINLDEEPEPLSSCCGARIIENTDLCSDCKEHCGEE